MQTKDADMFQRIKDCIRSIDPNARIVIFGSRARGDATKDSDWDILVLTDYPVTIESERAFRNRLFDLEMESGEVFSTFVYQKDDWNGRHRVTPLYRNIQREGVII